jgi:hypothetical protein
LVWALTILVVLPAVGGGVFGSHLRKGALYTSVSQLVIYAVYGLALGLASMRYIGPPVSASVPATIISRRRVVRGVGYAVLAVGIYYIGKSLLGSWLQSGAGRVRGGDGAFPDTIISR